MRMNVNTTHPLLVYLRWSAYSIEEISFDTCLIDTIKLALIIP
jgi:hypothetical protein